MQCSGPCPRGLETHLVQALFCSHIIPEEIFLGKLFPGFVYISFYHESFMEFLLEQRRSGDYWLEDHSTLATKVLCTFKDLYAMNGVSQGMSSIPQQHFLL